MTSFQEAFLSEALALEAQQAYPSAFCIMASPSTMPTTAFEMCRKSSR